MVRLKLLWRFVKIELLIPKQSDVRNPAQEEVF